MTLLDLEQNDVDISKLFEYTSELDIETPQGTIRIYQKLLGDEDYNKVKARALRDSKRARKKIKAGEQEKN